LNIKTLSKTTQLNPQKEPSSNPQSNVGKSVLGRSVNAKEEIPIGQKRF
jgi:hypothetical protein